MSDDEAPGFSLEYEALVGLLNTRISAGPLGIEILPDASFMVSPGRVAEIVNNTLGVPKPVLAKAFIAARRIFFEHVDNLAENAELILDTTSIILLFDPEHITAANARKRICLGFPYRARSEPEQLRRLEEELWFSRFLLISRLKRHNKSPTLWAHRRWLIKNFYSLGGLLLEPKWVLFEIEEVGLISAENHPRNYYAWDYMRWLIAERPGLDQKTRSELNRPLANMMEKWCKHHTSDTSGWSFLAWMILRQPQTDPRAGQNLQAHVGAEILDYAMLLGLKNLSLWKFLQEILGFPKSEEVDDVRLQYLTELSDLRAGEPKGSALQVFATKSLIAIGKYEESRTGLKMMVGGLVV
ncbi:hypothetical protein V499_07755 [Pseudogymnoascus sp. VKM F-103]|uniref:Uncharacterized protein n=1 Tax=Pseudogymnoascus verrucosus TaxID=342668 RepID=A0A1B8GEB8_9PEZI|nr:uncharacterized protein VE01_06990 [Pseudogymnoascus verrucosus]KFY72102.1 hypothetical protein V499_07755 [Pseudogymnoascus sp. VKM F-103]OBT94176.1 hypothetical protein VE01_06990 [Pseudogymnoascus verrucosus]